LFLLAVSSSRGKYTMFTRTVRQLAFFITIVATVLFLGSTGSPQIEIREYEGKRLDPFDRTYDNSIKGPQHVNPETYRLEVTGLVEHPQSLTYQQVLSLPIARRAVTLNCVEGWEEHLLFEGVRLADLFARARPQEGVRAVIFHAADGYSSSLPYDDVIRLDIMLAASINGRVLDANRGFPFQVVAESKLGYKWVKWVTRIELSDKSYKGYWEKRGYDNKADVNR